MSLLLYRIGVGVGEAGGSPPAHSLISDYFPPERRATALGVFSLGVPFGILVGFLAGGWLDQSLGWRMAFIVVGLPGLAVAVLVALTLREPPRGLSEGLTSDSSAAPSPFAVINSLWQMRSFRHVSFGAGLYAFVGYSVTTWAPSFLSRSHHMEQGDIGTALALIIGIGGGLGIYLGGVLSDRWALRDPKGRIYVPTIAMVLALPFGFVVYTTDNTTLALALLTVPSFLGLMFQAPVAAITQSLATPKTRATAAAVLLFVINIIGLAIGPAATGALSDALEPRYGDDALGYALMIVSCMLAWAAFHFYRSGRTLVADLERAREAGEREARGEN